MLGFIMNYAQALVCISASERYKQSPNDDPQIERETPILQVVQIALHPLPDRCVTAPTVDLGKSMKQRFHFSPKDSHYFQAEPLSLLPSRHSTTD